MLLNLCSSLLIDIFKHVPASTYPNLARTCSKFLKILQDEYLWKQYKMIDMTQVSENYFKFAKNKMRTYWTWNENYIIKLPNGFSTFSKYSSHYCVAKQPLTPGNNEVSFMMNFEEPNDHFQVGLYESSEINDMVGFTFHKAISYIKGTILYPDKINILDSSKCQVQRLKPLDFITFRQNFISNTVSILINNVFQMDVDVSGWKTLYPAKGMRKPTQIKFYYFK